MRIFLFFLSTIIRDILIPPCFLPREIEIPGGRKSLIYIPRETSIVFSARNIPQPRQSFLLLVLLLLATQVV